MKTYFDVPTQVGFYDVDSDKYLGGIAYRDEIICGCCGSIVEIPDLINESISAEIPMIVECLQWADITDVIFKGS